jgi:eukaryotic-like serine/threonine-protein kinase
LVVHRDLKPANAFVSNQGEVKLLDFGIAKLLEPSGSGAGRLATRDLSMALTPEYAAPEQLLGGPVTTASDVYSLGVLLYEILTGSRPLALDGKSPVEVERALLSEPIEPPSRFFTTRRGDDLDSIVLTALRAQPERRYVSAGQLGEDIARFLDGRPVLAKQDTYSYRARRFIGRNRTAVAVTALFAASLAAFGVVAGWQARRAAAERDAARLDRDKAEQIVDVLVDLFETSNPNRRPDGDHMSVRQFLLEAEPRVLEQLQAQPAVRARLQQVLGLVYAARDQFAEARRALEQSLAEQRRLLGPDHPETIESLLQLGLLLDEMGEAEGARRLLEEALDRGRRVFGEEHEKTARALASLASEDHVDEGIAMLERALAIRRRVLPPHHPDLADNLGRLARLHWLRGETDEARRLYSLALAPFRTADERRHPTAIMVMNDFAALLGQRGEYVEGEALLRESLMLSRVVFGKDSSAVADRTNNLASNLANQGRRAEAEQLFRESYDGHAALLGENHWRTANVARSVGAILALQERYADALPWIDKGIAIARRGPSSSGRTMELKMEGRRSMVLLRLGRGEEALRALRTAMTELEALEGDQAVQALTDLRAFHALALIETGRPAEAEAPARQALAAFDALGNEKSRAWAECLLGWALVLSGRRGEGRAALARCLPLYREWGLADPGMVAGIGRALAAPAASD